MAREPKQKVPSYKEALYDIVGAALANTLDLDVMKERTKTSDTPKCLYVSGTDGFDYSITITQKKSGVDYDDEYIDVAYGPQGPQELER